MSLETHSIDSTPLSSRGTSPVQVQELPKEKRTLALQLALGELQMPKAFGMPSDPRLLFGGLNVEECKVMDCHCHCHSLLHCHLCTSTSTSPRPPSPSVR